MTPELIAIFALEISIPVFLWNIQRDIGILHRAHTDLRERMSRLLESLLEGFAQPHPADRG